MYGDFLNTFLFERNCCILNGRQIMIIISPRGNSVVDYFIVPYEHLERPYEHLECVLRGLR